MESNEKEVITSENVNNYIGKRVTTWQRDNVTTFTGYILG